MKSIYLAACFISLALFPCTVRSEDFSSSDLMKLDKAMSTYQGREREISSEIFEELGRTYNKLWIAQAALSACNKHGLVSTLAEYDSLVKTDMDHLITDKVTDVLLDGKKDEKQLKPEDVVAASNAMQSVGFRTEGLINGFKMGVLALVSGMFAAEEQGKVQVDAEAFCGRSVDAATAFIEDNKSRKDALEGAAAAVKDFLEDKN